MEVKATAKTVRVTPRKARLVLDLIRGKNANEAMAILKFTPNHAAEVISKVLKSAMANASHNNQMDVEKLYIAGKRKGAQYSRFEYYVIEAAMWARACSKNYHGYDEKWQS